MENVERKAEGGREHDRKATSSAADPRIAEEDKRTRISPASLVRANAECKDCEAVGKIRTLVHGSGTNAFCTDCDKKCSKEET